MGKMSDIYTLLGETIDRLMEEKPSGTADELYTSLLSKRDEVGVSLMCQAYGDAKTQYKAWDSACMNLRSMKDGLITIDEPYLWAVRDFFQMDKHLPREETGDGDKGL